VTTKPDRSSPIVCIGFVLFHSILACSAWGRPESVVGVLSLDEFAEQVDLRPLHAIAVQADGRLRSFESHAKTYMGYVSGPRRIDGHSFGFTYLDLMFRPEVYADKDVIYVKNKQVRAQILAALKDHALLTPSRREAIMDSGLIARGLLAEPAAAALLRRLGEDLIRTAKVVDSIQSAITVSQGNVLEELLRLIPPMSDNVMAPWFSPAALSADGESGAVPGGAHRAALRTAWLELRAAWRNQHVAKINERILQLADLLPTISPEVYPSGRRLALESWYFRNKSMTWVWWIYAASLAPLLMSVVYHWGGARWTGLGLFYLGFAGHTASLLIRWYISGRWPNSNMFEAVHTSAWLGGAAAILLEIVARRSPLRNLFALGSAAASMAALMAAYFLPAQLDSSINNKMAALNDVWLYIHTNMIILSYALITFCCVTALLTLGHRWILSGRERRIGWWRRMLLPPAVAVLHGTGYLLLMHVIDHDHRGLSPQAFGATAAAFAGAALMLVLELAAAWAPGAPVRASAGGAASLILGLGPRHAFVREPGPTLGQVLDGATMVLLELSFITLWTGIVMGAIWADHSWGRPWGWDPKEVFALNTFVIFLILVHVRLKVRDKTFWTAVLAVIGFEVMIFNWIVVNFIISGLHSYA
jgi:cytochrome c-type biogenesis protein CcsB